MPNTPLDDAQSMLALANAIGGRVREHDQEITDLSSADLEELRTDLADTVAASSATIAEIKTLLAAREGE